MSQSEPVSILIVNERAEEVKLATISFRGFFSGSHIDAAYSAEEARGMIAVSAQEWALILIDDGCLSDDDRSLIEDLRRHTPYAGLLFQSERADSASALRALQTGADYFLSKQSPAFLIELLFCAREALEKHALQQAAERIQIRHQHLAESLGDLFYELDAEGRFVALSPGIQALLGYTPGELIGLSYLTLFRREEQPAARFRFNERRSIGRSTRRFELTFLPKLTQTEPPRLVQAEVSARGLYDPRRRFLGTVGLVRVIPRTAQEDAASRQQDQEHRYREALQTLAKRMSELSRNLQQSLARLHDEAQQLLEILREVRLDERIEQLSVQASAASQLGENLAKTLHESLGGPSPSTINDLLAKLLISAPHLHSDGGVETQFSPQLPAYYGDHDRAVELFRRLFAYAQTYLKIVGRSRRLVVRTSGVGMPSEMDAPALFPLMPPSAVDVDISESDVEIPQTAEELQETERVDLFDLYRLVSELGGTLDLSAPTAGPLRILVRLPLMTAPQAAAPPTSLPVTEPPTTAPIQDRQRPALEQVAAAPTSTTAPSTERRTAVRVTTTLPAHITIDSTAWEGTVTNLGPGGACVTLPASFPQIVSQATYIVLRTAAGILELSGSAYARTVPTATALSQLVIVFDTPKPTEADVLASLIDAAREQSITFSLDVLLTSSMPAPSTTADHSSDAAEHERRESVRVVVKLPIRLETTQHREPATRLVAQTINVSRDGACLVVKARPEQLRGPVVFHFAPAHAVTQPGSHEPGAPDSALPASIVWSAPDPTASSQFHPQGFDQAAQIGVRFQSLTPYAERELTRLVRQHLASPPSTTVSADQPSVASIPRECRNPRGQTIAILDDHLSEPVAPDIPVLVIAPGYGQTASDYLALSYFMVFHRLRVLRYDHTNHIGISEGELQNTTLRSMQTDLSKVVEFVHHTWPTAPVILLASDLTARASINMAVYGRPLDLLLLANPVVDVGAALMAVHGHDLVSDYRYGVRRGIANLLGLNVNLDQFLGDLIAGHLTDLASTLNDIRLVRSPLGLITSPRSEPSPLPPADLPHAFVTALGTHARVLAVPTSLSSQDLSSHEPYPASFRTILEQIATALSLPFPVADIGPQARRDFARRRLMEQEQTRLRHHLSQISRDALEIAHFQQSPQLGNLHEYRKLLDDLYALLSPLHSGMVIVDAGIGQSDLTRTLLVNHTYRARQRAPVPDLPPLLIGVGRSAEMIVHAQHSVRMLRRELATGVTDGLAALPALTTDWVQADWMQSLPFHTGSIHRFVCNLSLPFVPSPFAAVHEWRRVLHPEGRLVLTSFHPQTDLSLLYRDHLRRSGQDEFSQQAQLVLHYFGRLREAIRHGVLHTFDHRALTVLLHRSGLAPVRISPIFNGQAFVAVVGKQNSSSSL
jgi:PAS domain S-box-containing protein